MTYLQIATICLALSSVAMIAYVSFTNSQAVKKIDKDKFGGIDLL